MNKIAVSACLIGKNTKYDGENNYNQYVVNYLKDKEYILICPEILGGLPVPRKPSEIKENIVINSNGDDVTYQFIYGSQKALELILKNNIDTVILKSHSPSCGPEQIYDGTFSHTLINQDGMLVRMLRKYQNIKILTEKDLEK